MPLFSYDFTKIALISRGVIRSMTYVRTANTFCMSRVAGQLYQSALPNEAALLPFQGVCRISGESHITLTFPGQCAARAVMR